MKHHNLQVNKHEGIKEKNHSISQINRYDQEPKRKILKSETKICFVQKESNGRILIEVNVSEMTLEQHLENNKNVSKNFEYSLLYKINILKKKYFFMLTN